MRCMIPCKWSLALIVVGSLYTPPFLHLATSEMWRWSGGRGILTELYLFYSILCTRIMVHNGTGFDLASFIYLLSASVSSWCYIYIYNFSLQSLFRLLVIWAWWDWPLTWLTNYWPLVLWLCWLGHQTRKSFPEWHVSSRTLNTTIQLNHHTLQLQHSNENQPQFKRTWTSTRMPALSHLLHQYLP